MPVWMLYATSVGVAFSLAALLAESGFRRLARSRRPGGGRGASARVVPSVHGGVRRIRWVWAAAMAATVLVPLAAGLAGSPASPGAGSHGWPLVPVDTAAVLVWAGAALVLLADIRLSGWTVRRNARSWRPDRRAGRAVLVSAAFGPGVIGARDPRIVLPEWAVRAGSGLERFIVVHEEEHVRAGDTRLLLAAAVLVALVPWCLPLWWQLHRLRGAIEMDCDARVVARTGDARAYARALVAVAGRRSRSGLPVPVPALSPTRGELERRIRHVTARRSPRARRGAVARVVAAAVVAIAAAVVPAPELPLPSLDLASSGDAVSNEGPWREATVILSVEP